MTISFINMNVNSQMYHYHIQILFCRFSLLTYEILHNTRNNKQNQKIKRCIQFKPKNLRQRRISNLCFNSIKNTF